MHAFHVEISEISDCESLHGRIIYLWQEENNNVPQMSVLWDFAAHMIFVWSLMTVIFDEFAVLNGKVKCFYIRSYFTTSILTRPSAKNDMPSADKSVYNVAESTCSPSFTNISALKRSNINRRRIRPF